MAAFALVLAVLCSSHISASPLEGFSLTDLSGVHVLGNGPDNLHQTRLKGDEPLRPRFSHSGVSVHVRLKRSQRSTIADNLIVTDLTNRTGVVIDIPAYETEDHSVLVNFFHDGSIDGLKTHADLETTLHIRSSVDGRELNIVVPLENVTYAVLDPNGGAARTYKADAIHKTKLQVDTWVGDGTCFPGNDLKMKMNLGIIVDENLYKRLGSTDEAITHDKIFGEELFAATVSLIILLLSSKIVAGKRGGFNACDWLQAFTLFFIFLVGNAEATRVTNLIQAQQWQQSLFNGTSRQKANQREDFAEAKETISVNQQKINRPNFRAESLVTPVSAPGKLLRVGPNGRPLIGNECNPTAGCNVCSACCNKYIPDGSACDSCVDETCPTVNCDPAAGACTCPGTCCSHYIPAQQCAACVKEQCVGLWHLVAPMSTKRGVGLAVVSFEGKLYSIGGRNEYDYVLDTAEAYDPKAKTWTPIASMTTKRFYHGAAVLFGKIYAVGGFGVSINALDTVEAYDPGANTWTAVASMATTRGFLGVAVVGDKLYAVGGQDEGDNNLDTVEAYDPGANRWTAVASMVNSRDALRVAAVGGKLYAVGGYDKFSNTLNTVEAYDPEENTWTAVAVARMTTARRQLGVAVVGDKLYAVGGIDGSHALDTVEAYDPEENTWTAVAGMTTKRDGLGVAAVGATLYAVGGCDGGACATVEALNL